MNIECVKEKLESIISRATRITGKSATLPVLQCVFLEAKNNTLTVRATNLDIGVEYSLPVKVVEEGVVAVPGTTLSSFLSHVADKNITLKTSEEGVTVKTDSTKTTIRVCSPEDFPAIPYIKDGTSFQINAKTLTEGMRSVAYSAATSSMKPELSSVYMAPSDDQNHLIFAATDSFRLAEKRVSVDKPLSFEYVLIPVKNTGEIIRVLDELEDEVDVFVGDNQIAFSGEGVYLTSRTVEGIFPDYQQIIPQKFVADATLLKSDLVNAFKVAHIFTDTFNKVIVSALPSKKQFEVQTKNTEVGENKQNLEGALSGEDVTITFNHKYITDCFQSISTDSISLELAGEGKPMVVRGVSNTSFLYLVMPMNQ